MGAEKLAADVDALRGRGAYRRPRATWVYAEDRDDLLAKLDRWASAAAQRAVAQADGDPGEST